MGLSTSLPECVLYWRIRLQKLQRKTYQPLREGKQKNMSLLQSRTGHALQVATLPVEVTTPSRKASPWSSPSCPCRSPSSNRCHLPSSNPCRSPSCNLRHLPSSSPCRSPSCNLRHLPSSSPCRSPSCNLCHLPSSSPCRSPSCNLCHLHSSSPCRSPSRPTIPCSPCPSSRSLCHDHGSDASDHDVDDGHCRCGPSRPQTPQTCPPSSC
mmetsp:Transcript_69084/g.144269  ORF Transcript_69084/g.144269 Transcript_69084/m.144269 type:complete len:210 (-) Transcript_69084:587-1216(-)